MADKISHLNNAGFLKSEHKKRTELSLPNGAGYIFSYHPFLIFILPRFPTFGSSDSERVTKDGISAH